MTSEIKVTALVMAGKRSGAMDPLAAQAGVTQKAVVPVDGIPMVERVVSHLAACPDVGRIHVVAHDDGEMAALPTLAPLISEARLRMVGGAFNLVDSVFKGADGASYPLLITTADNCLLTAEGYREFIARCQSANADAAAGFAHKEDVMEADPLGQKRFYEFRDGGYSNCNVYWIKSPDTLKGAEIMRQGGQFVKFPSRMLKAFGLLNLVRFLLRINTQERLFEHLSRRFGFSLVPVVMSDGHYAIDVDNDRTLAVTEKILQRREGDCTATPGTSSE